MRTKVLLYAALAANVALSSCTREPEEESGLLNSGMELEFTAAWADAKSISDVGTDSRTVLQEDGTSIWWTTGEEINVFLENGVSGKFTSTNTEPAATASFSGILSGPSTMTEENELETVYWAVYPYSEENSFDGQGLILKLPAEQAASSGTFADKFFPSIARGDSYFLDFWNVSGGARFSVVTKGVEKVVFKSKSGRPMAGKIKVGFDDNGRPQILDISDPVDSVVIRASGKGFVPGVYYYAAMIPQKHIDGITIILNTSDKKATTTLENSITIRRSTFGILDKMDDGLAYVDTKDYSVPEIVDLGLSVKWSSFNLGASTPEEYGDFFSWGEIGSKSDYNWSSYRWCNGNYNSLTKYCSNTSYGAAGFVDNYSELELDDDAPHTLLGDKWRMPTSEEWAELKDNCNWDWTTINGVKGMKVSSKLSGYVDKWIFFPAAGYIDGSNGYDSGLYGYYWSSSLNEGNPRNAYFSGFSSGGVGIHSDNRCGGFSIRPVFSDVKLTGIQIQQSTMKFVAGASATLLVSPIPSDASLPILTWSTSNSSVATVSSHGVVSAVAAGSCVITAQTPLGIKSSCSISVSPSSGYENGYEWVDLGLSVKWATYNVWAKTNTESGGYFAWGETGTRSNYTWEWHKWWYGKDNWDYNWSGWGSLLKYCTDYKYGYQGFVDNKTELELSDDAARAKWKGTWRIPTMAEWKELVDNCTHKSTLNGSLLIEQFTSKINNKTVSFLSKPGYMNGTGCYYGSSQGYWSTSIKTSDPREAYFIDFTFLKFDSSLRCYGRPIRAVCE